MTLLSHIKAVPLFNEIDLRTKITQKTSMAQNIKKHIQLTNQDFDSDSIVESSSLEPLPQTDLNMLLCEDLEPDRISINEEAKSP